MSRSLLLALASLFSAFPLAASSPVASEGEPQEELVLATYDLGAVLPGVDSSKLEASLMLPPAGGAALGLPEVGAEHYARPSADVVMNIVSRALEDEFLERGRDLSLQDETTLLLLAPAETHAKVRGVIDALRGVVAGSAVLRVDVLTSSAAGKMPGNNVVAASEVDRMVAQAGADVEHQSFEIQLEAGRTAHLDQSESVSFLFDYDVEIAHGSCVFDPVVLTTREGLRCLLRAAPAGGGLALSVHLQSSWIDPGEPLALNLTAMVGREDAGMAMLEGPGVIESPEVLVHGFAANTFLPDGKALLFATETVVGGQTRRQVIALRRQGEGMLPYASHPIPGTGRRLLALNSELFRAPFVEVLEFRNPWTGTHPLLTARMQGEPSHFLLSWMRNFAVWDRLGPWVLVVTDRGWDGNNAQKLEQLVRGRMEPPALVSVEVELQSGSSDRPARCSLPIRLGSEAGVVAGRTGTLVADFDVEVAMFAGVADPVVTPTFDGLAARLGVLPGEGPERVLTVKGAAHLARKPSGEIHLKGALLDRLELPRYDSLELGERRKLPASDGAARVKLGPASDGLSLNVTVR